MMTSEVVMSSMIGVSNDCDRSGRVTKCPIHPHRIFTTPDKIKTIFVGVLPHLPFGSASTLQPFSEYSFHKTLLGTKCNTKPDCVFFEELGNGTGFRGEPLRGSDAPSPQF